MPPAPAWLNEHGKREWTRLGRALRCLGLFTILDTTALAMYATAYGRWAAAELALADLIGEAGLVDVLVSHSDKGNPYQNPLLSIAHTAWEQMRKMLAEFGLSPATRLQLVGVEPPVGEQQDFLEQLFRVQVMLDPDSDDDDDDDDGG